MRQNLKFKSSVAHKFKAQGFNLRGANKSFPRYFPPQAAIKITVATTRIHFSMLSTSMISEWQTFLNIVATTNVYNYSKRNRNSPTLCGIKIPKWRLPHGTMRTNVANPYHGFIFQSRQMFLSDLIDA